MTDVELLLTVQELDTTAAQLRHRREVLPERAALVARQETLAGIAAAVDDATKRLDDLARHERRLEDEITMVVDKAHQVDRTMYSGTVTNPRELQGMHDELGALGRRQRTLEDEVIVLMEQTEPIEAELERLEEQRAAVDAEAVTITAALVEAEVAIDGELAEVEAQRAELVGSVPPDLVAEYEQLRRRLGGTGIARLSGSNCGGCHLTLPAVEIDRIRHGRAGERVHCSECGRLLVA